MQVTEGLWEEGEQVVVEVEVSQVGQLTNGVREKHEVVLRQFKESEVTEVT